MIEALSDISRGGTSAFAADGVGGSSNVFIQQTDPALPTPYIWYKTDASGNVVDILKGGS